MSTEPLLEVRDLSVTFPTEAGPVAAVRKLSYHVMPGEVLGIVGESGSGKSVSSLAVIGLLPARAKITGSIRFKGAELLGRSDKEMSAIRGRGISMIFQDPLSAMTPVYTVGDQIAEAVRIHQKVTEQAAMKRAVELLDLVGMDTQKLLCEAMHGITNEPRAACPPLVKRMIAAGWLGRKSGRGFHNYADSKMYGA